MNSEMMFKHTTLLALGCLCPFTPRTQPWTHRGLTALIQCSHSSGELSRSRLMSRTIVRKLQISAFTLLNSPKNHIEETDGLKAVSSQSSESTELWAFLWNALMSAAKSFRHMSYTVFRLLLRRQCPHILHVALKISYRYRTPYLNASKGKHL